jgi:hypothetical protein
MAQIAKCIENTASEKIMTATSQIARIAPMPGARHQRPPLETTSFDTHKLSTGALLSRLDARLASRAPSANCGNAQIAKPSENTASERVVTTTSPIAPIAPISPDWRHLAESFCRLGATEEQLAELFCVTPQTIAGWMAEIRDFADAVRSGRDLADADVANSLHHLAVGYSHRVERVLKGRNGPLTVSYTKHYPPHSKSCMDWLVNRRPDLWGRAAIKRKLQAADEARDAAPAGRRSCRLRRSRRWSSRAKRRSRTRFSLTPPRRWLHAAPGSSRATSSPRRSGRGAVAIFRMSARQAAVRFSHACPASARQ